MTMPRAKSGAGQEQIPPFSVFLKTWSGAGPEQVFNGPGLVWGKFLVVRGKFFSRYQERFCVKFS